MKFSELNINIQLAQAIERKGYQTPSEVQEKTIPLILSGKDVIAQAKTGSGKTAAFAIPLLEKVKPAEQSIQALVLVPTRELAQQVQKEVQILAQWQTIRCLPVFGGQSIQVQKEDLRKGQHIIAATPGRLLDLMSRSWIDLSHVQYVVLDEADKMFDMGFRDDLARILGKLPRERQTLLFSATMPEPIRRLAQQYLKKDKVFVNVSQDTLVVENIRQYFVRVDPKKRVSTLIDLIKKNQMNKCLVFCRTQRTADWLSRELYRRKIQCRSIHGGLSQNIRERTMNQFKQGGISVLIGTDLVSRGLHMEDISHVINFDFPQTPETYVHRIGRTARFGKDGDAITFCTQLLEIETLEKIQNDMQTTIEEMHEFNS